MRRSRERRRQGFLTVLVDLHCSEVARLIARLLVLEHSQDPDAIGCVIERLLEAEARVQRSKGQAAEEVEALWAAKALADELPLDH